MNCIEKLISQNGNWRLQYVYNRYGDDILFLLPYFNDDDISKNEILVEMCNSTHEESIIIDNFISKNPDTPFIIQRNNIVDCINNMNSRLDKLIDGDDYSKFIECSSKFDEFRIACLNINHLDAYNDACYKGWEKYV